METLYNGIRLPDEWPPRSLDPASDAPMEVPYLRNPPAVVPIDVGRQLFVDDFLIEQTTMERRFHAAEPHPGNPVLFPQTAPEQAGLLPAAVPKSGGVWWDQADGCFRMWYEAGWFGSMAYAVSYDGLRWLRPALDIEPPTNRLLPGLVPDSTAVFIDADCGDPAQRCKMFLRGPNVQGAKSGWSMVSGDGVHWSEPVATGPCGDRSTIFYNPFRKVWVYSLRSSVPERGRTRAYREHRDFLAGARWRPEDCVFWAAADRLDPPDPTIGDKAQLYNLDAVAYESLMLGLFEIHLGPHNRICAEGGFPKTTELMTAFSRDGFHWDRPERRAFIPASRRVGAWDRGYVQSVGGACLVVGDELWFYYTGFRGDETRRLNRDGLTDLHASGMHAHGSTGIARLRRDGFASMCAGEREATLLTRPLLFSGEHLFVNLRNPNGLLAVEVCAVDGKPLRGFSRADCLPVAVDATKTRIKWQAADSLRPLARTPVRFRFHMARGELFSFWVSGSPAGASGGYAGAGGPGFAAARDL